MEASEMFLMAWAVVATMLAVYFNHQARSRGIAMFALMMGFRHVAEGKAEVYMDGEQLRIKEKEDVTT